MNSSRAVCHGLNGKSALHSYQCEIRPPFVRRISKFFRGTSGGDLAIASVKRGAFAGSSVLCDVENSQDADARFLFARSRSPINQACRSRSTGMLSVASAWKGSRLFRVPARGLSLRWPYLPGYSSSKDVIKSSSFSSRSSAWSSVSLPLFRNASTWLRKALS